MRVLQIHTNYRNAGGEDAVVAAEAALLRDHGHVVSEWRNQNPTGAAAAAGALALSSWNPAVARRFARDTAADHDVAHVHNTWFATTPSILPVLEKRRIPVVMTLHNYRLACSNALLMRDGAPCELCVGSHPWHGVRYRCYRDSAIESTFAAAAIALNRWRSAWDRVDRFLALTEFARTKMIEAGLPAEKVAVKPNFVADPGPREVAPSGSDQVLFVGRLSREKGVATLIEAWGRNASGDLRLVVAGDGPLMSELQAARTPGVTLVGRVDAETVRSLMLSSRALVFPSEWYEGMPITLLEAFAAGLPVVASDLGSMREMVSPLGADWLVTPGDPDALATAIASLSTRDVDVAGDVARTTWESRYSPTVAIDALLDAYRL